MTLAFFFAKLLLWVLIIYGTSQIVVDSVLFESFRNKITRWKPLFGELVTCMLCTSVWISLIFSVILWSPSKAMFAYDLVNVENLTDMQIRLMYGVHTFEDALTYFIFRGYVFWAHIKATFFDMMLGSCSVWFMYLQEKKIISLSKKNTIYKQE